MSGAASPPRPSRGRVRRSRSLGAAVTLFVGLGLGLAQSPAAAGTTAPAPGPVLGSGQSASSPNVSLVANLPKRGAFAGATAFNSDLAFAGSNAYAGNYNGFTVYDIKNPKKPREVTQLLCPGSQNDITVSGNLLFLSVDSRRTDDTCNSAPATAAQSAAGQYWEGIRIFDITSPSAPRYIKSVETDCGSHTHTLVPGKDGKDVFLYVSSYGPSAAIAKCQPPHDKVSIVKVPVKNPTAAAVVAEPVLFPDGGLTPRTQGCHDITAYPEVGLAAGACMGEGVIIDIANPVMPKVVERVADTVNFDFWHSATFNNDADTVLFTDELGGGGAATCNPAIGPNKGADALYTLGRDNTLSFASYYKIPRTQSTTENCVAHNGSLIPVKGKDVMVQAWYQGGISIFDFTNPKKPTELGWYDRGPISDTALVLGGSWSAYYYQGYIYSNDIQKGLDVFQIKDPRVNSAKSGQFPADYNPQSQPTF